MKESSAEYPGRPIAVGKELSRSGLQVCDGEAIRRPEQQNQPSMRKPSAGRGIRYKPPLITSRQPQGFLRSDPRKSAAQEPL